MEALRDVNGNKRQRDADDADRGSWASKYALVINAKHYDEINTFFVPLGKPDHVPLPELVKVALDAEKKISVTVEPKKGIDGFEKLVDLFKTQIVEVCGTEIVEFFLTDKFKVSLEKVIQKFMTWVDCVCTSENELEFKKKQPLGRIVLLLTVLNDE